MEGHQRTPKLQDTLVLSCRYNAFNAHRHTQCSPSDFPAGGEVEEDRALHDVELALSSAADTTEGILRTLKFNKSLSETRHHGNVAGGRRGGSCTG